MSKQLQPKILQSDTDQGLENAIKTFISSFENRGVEINIEKISYSCHKKYTQGNELHHSVLIMYTAKTKYPKSPSFQTD